MARANIDKGVQGQTVKPFNGTRGIFIPYSLLDSLHGDYYAAAIVSQLFYWMQVGNENMWKLQTKKEISKQLRMEYKTFSRHLKKLIESGIVIVERRGIHNVVRLNQDKFALLNIDEVAQIVDKMSTNSGQNVYYIEDKMSTEKTRPQETTTETTNSGQNVYNEVDKMSTNSGQNVYYIVDKMSTNSGQNVHFDKSQSLQPQQIAEALDYNKIYNKINNKIKNKNILSSDINFSKLEKGVISELKNALADSQDIPKELEEVLLSEMLRAGFPRKSLRSRIDRENLHILWEHYGSWETVIKAFQNLQKLQKEGRFLEWNWSKILRNADYLATYEPEPYFPVDRIDDLEGLRRYFAKVRPPKKYVARFIYRWVEHWKFVDMPPERTKRLIEEILKYYYSDSQEAGVDSQKIQEERSKIVSMMQKSQRVY